ncbi:MAG: toll/interleukin-1 receptor domain-containing protein [Methylococcaceae bacterium]|nr:toll/interleukin-1 receptor domain-containing protein [Methylococcaceae bacterium]
MPEHSIYVSYAWKAEAERGVVDALEKIFEANGIRLNRDRNLGYKDSIKDFMEKLGKGDFVVVVLSEAYLKSQYCMSELIEIHGNGEFHQRVFPVLLEGTRIDRAKDRLPFIRFWEDEYADLERQTKEGSLRRIDGIHDDLNLYSNIRDSIDRLLDILGDMNSLTEDVHVGTNFEALVNQIKAKIPSLADYESDQAGSEKFRQKVLSMLNQEIDRAVCRQLKDGLIDVTGQDDVIRALEKSCQQEKNGLEQAVKWLYSATKRTLRAMRDKNPNDPEQERFFGAAQTILGWLILLSVNDHWFGKNRGLFQDDNKSIRIELPVRTDAAIEIVLSRTKQVPARFEANPTGSAVYGRHAMGTASPESGWSQDTAWQEIKLTVWNRLFKETRSKPLSEQDTQTLQGLLKFRSEEGSNYYFTIRPSDEKSPLNRQEIVAKFREELPALKLISIGLVGEQPVLLASEIDLGVLIMEFLNLRRIGDDD